MKDENKGILLILLSSLCFAVMSASVKAIPHVPIAEKIFFRNLIGTLIIGSIIIKKKKSFIGNNVKLLTFRSILGLLGVAANYYAISKLPLSDAVLLNKMSPFFVILLSLIILKEKVANLQIYAMLVALLGAGFVIKPQFDYTIIPAMVGLTSAVFAASAYILVRQLRLYADPETIVFFFSLFSAIVSIPFMLSGQYVPPTASDLVPLILIGVSAAGAQISMTTAYRLAPASQIAIYGYANIIFSTVFGIVLWSEFPDLLSVTGGILIILGGFINYVANNPDLLGCVMKPNERK